MKTLGQCKAEVAKRHNYVFEGSQAAKEREVAQLYAEELAKAFYNWISSEGGIDTIHDLQIVGELPKGTPSFDQLKPHFKASLKQKI